MASRIIRKWTIVTLALLCGCVSVREVKPGDLDAREQEQLTAAPGLRVFGYVSSGGVEQKLDAFVRMEEGKDYEFHPYGEHAAVPAFAVQESELEALLLERTDAVKTVFAIPAYAVMGVAFFVIAAVAAGGAAA